MPLNARQSPLPRYDTNDTNALSSRGGNVEEEEDASDGRLILTTRKVTLGRYLGEWWKI